jgi:hypothetical protein
MYTNYDSIQFLTPQYDTEASDERLDPSDPRAIERQELEFQRRLLALEQNYERSGLKGFASDQTLINEWKTALSTELTSLALKMKNDSTLETDLVFLQRAFKISERLIEVSDVLRTVMPQIMGQLDFVIAYNYAVFFLNFQDPYLNKLELKVNQRFAETTSGTVQDGFNYNSGDECSECSDSGDELEEDPHQTHSPTHDDMVDDERSLTGHGALGTVDAAEDID